MKTDSTIDSTHLAWVDIQGSASEASRQQVAAVVDEEASSLTDLFYAEMLADPDAARFLDHAVVSQRLHASMERWLRHLFVAGTPVEDCIAEQRKTGEVHARIGISMDLISNGARVLKRGITRLIVARGLPMDTLAGAIQYVYELVDLAIGTMNMAYASNTSRIARSDEAYRLLFLGRDMRAERERQRTQLLEWAHQILMQYYWNFQGAPPAGGLGFTRSQFGLWLQHKAAMLFEGAPEIERIRESIETIEDQLLPDLTRARSSHDEARTIVTAINRHVDLVKDLLGTMFDRLIETQDGRDSVTRLLNRRYFPAIAKREIAFAQQREDAFALLLVEIDQFARLRTTPDLDAPDLILSQVADALLDNVRAGDFVFRIGEERFAVLLVETERHSVGDVADGLRQRIEHLNLLGGSRLATSVTASIGVTLFDGHPDYQRMLERAEDALLTARQEGGNRCVLAA